MTALKSTVLLRALSLLVCTLAGISGSPNAVQAQLFDQAVVVSADSLASARDGFILHPRLASSLNSGKTRFESQGSTTFISKIEGGFRGGETWKQPELAETLQRIADQGRDGFYTGTTASLIESRMLASGGIITANDLESYESVWRQPVKTTYKGYDLTMMPLPSSGGMVMTQVLQMIEPYNLQRMGHNTPETIHLVSEALRRSFADRNHHLGDPDFVEVPVSTLLDPVYNRMRMADFKPGYFTPSLAVRPGNPARYAEPMETTHLSVMDAGGNAVAMTVTLNGSYGSYVEVSGAGFLMNNEMDDFSAKPGTPNMFGLTGTEANAIAPGKRMLSSMTPTIVARESKVMMVLGAAGGPRIITAVLQCFLNAAEFGMNGEEAVSAPRFHHQWFPDEIRVEAGVLDPAETFRLEMMGHKIVTGGSLANANIIVVNPAGKLVGGPDPRGYGRASGY